MPFSTVLLESRFLGILRVRDGIIILIIIIIIIIIIIYLQGVV